MSRTNKSVKNFAVALMGQGIGLIISFISRIFFIRILGSEYLGLNGLFTNILTVLSLAELGVGEAITYSLYKPLAKKDEYKCKMLMQFYKKVYVVIGCFIFIVGILLTPVLPYLINNLPDIKNINLIYILFVLNTAISYFYSYKRNLIIADQNRYIATIYRYGFYIILNIAQVIYLICTKNYIGYLVLQVLFTFLENFLISFKANKMYPYLTDKSKITLDKKSKNEIIKNTKAMMMHKIGGVVVTSTDNILLSHFIGLTAVGLYSNYYMVIYALNLVFGQLFSSLTASIGNLCTEDNKKKEYSVFKRIDFMTFWIYGFSAVCLASLFNPFIEIWVGTDYLLSMSITIVLVINFYISGMRKSVMTFREASGLFYKDRWKAVAEAIINLVVSMVLATKCGMIGIFLGTLVSSLTTCFWVEPYILYKYGFKMKLSSYFRNYFKKTLLVLAVATFVYLLCNFIHFNLYLSFAIKLLICLIIPNLIFYVIYRKSDELTYFLNLIKSKVKK